MKIFIGLLCNGTRPGRIKILRIQKLKNYSKNQGELYTCPNRFRVSPDRVQGYHVRVCPTASHDGRHKGY